MLDCKATPATSSFRSVFLGVVQRTKHKTMQENKKLKDELTRIKIAVDSFLNDGGAVGERGKACMRLMEVICESNSRTNSAN